MYLFRRKQPTPAIQMHRNDGTSTPMSITFKNGEMHINPDRMDKGTYELTISHGIKVEKRCITIA
ncbi:MAG: hypothetical protein HKN87_05440 [Saprospiraceae bacterium]|nr:hypothetical protein [Saprospiraceae bacterium]